MPREPASRRICSTVAVRRVRGRSHTPMRNSNDHRAAHSDTEWAMRRVIVQEFLTLDGVMQAPGRPDEDTRSNFAFGGWTAPYFAEADSAAGAFMSKLLKPSDLLLGRWTYDMFADYWPKHADSWPGVLDVTKYVVSRTLSEEQVAGSGWQNSVLLSSIEEVKDLKTTEGSSLKVIGSSVLTQALLAQDLVDELVLMTFPLVLGS